MLTRFYVYLTTYFEQTCVNILFLAYLMRYSIIMHSEDLRGTGRGLFQGTTQPGEPEKIQKH
jgi:hypothetical protein